MKSGKKIVKIGFDLDGVIVDKPFLIPKALLERLSRGKQENELHYRYPKTKLERRIRKLSHFYLFRPPLRQNINFIKDLKKQGCKLYLVSSRYSFLKRETMVWLEKRKLNNVFEKVFLNLNDKQPHLFKREVLERLNLDYFFEDDKRIVDYLKKKISSAKIYLVNSKQLIPPVFKDVKA
ncbi:hypothetical protein COT63_01275 [Candidatus Shapirobacteria bacterium CG09_land_8_20_14_0_10_38_17]|uniref:FCP1 homology domain-containing protein n=1 Tax=Candidatus Shapirobacteria bacterium CG09_land_8_20_14_0_10_38_17 TaxID=1974884 RepID=A0A2H0WRA7_9BACT|nr:MAG: hypothetical protein COT63_01275 [Candidatus Shapirobacteria bacterium CG09_land_8_20_14_0_10_38_17]